MSSLENAVRGLFNKGISLSILIVLESLICYTKRLTANVNINCFNSLETGDVKYVG